MGEPPLQHIGTAYLALFGATKPLRAHRRIDVEAAAKVTRPAFKRQGARRRVYNEVAENITVTSTQLPWASPYALSSQLRLL
jgi:hypothetical protein